MSITGNCTVVVRAGERLARQTANGAVGRNLLEEPSYYTNHGEARDGAVDCLAFAVRGVDIGQVVCPGAAAGARCWVVVSVYAGQVTRDDGG